MTTKIESIANNYISRRELAHDLGERLRGRPFGEGWLIKLEQRGKGPPPTRIGRVVLYHLDSVERWMRDQENAA